jgi:hypothetical protein
MSGGVVQLVAVGPQDAWLTGKPEVSFYRSNYRRYTHFANSIERQVIQGTPIANGISTIRFEKKGDLLSYVYLTARDNNGAGIVGLDWSKVIDKVELMIGGQIVDTHDFEYMADIEPLVGAQNWSQRYLNLNNASLNNQKASFFPFKFFFCKEWTLCLPLIGLQFHDVEIRITWSSYLNQTITFGVPTNISATQVSQLTATSATVTLPAGATGTLAATGGVSGSVLGFKVGDTITFAGGAYGASSFSVASVSASTSSITVTIGGGSTTSTIPVGEIVSDTTASPNFKAILSAAVPAGASPLTLNLLPIPNQVYLNGTLPNASAVAIASSTTVTSATVSFPYGFTSNVYAGAPPLAVVASTSAVIPPASYPITPTYSSPKVTLTYNGAMTTAPNAGEFALGIQGINPAGTWQGAFVTFKDTTAPVVTLIPTPTSYAVPTVTSNIVYVQPVYTTPIVVASVSGASGSAVAGISVAISGLSSSGTSLLVPGSAFIYKSTSATIPVSTVTVASTSGAFTLSSPALNPLAVGQTIIIGGTKGAGAGDIAGGAATYYIIATNGSTTFTLSSSRGGAGTTTTAGALTGFTLTLSGNAAPNLYYTGIVESVASDTSAVVHFPLGSQAIAVNVATYAVTPSSTASPVLVSSTAAAQTGTAVFTLNNITGAQPTVGQLVAGLDFTVANAPTLIGAYLTSINTSVTPTQYTVSYYCGFADGTAGSVPTLSILTAPPMISFFNISVPVTALTGTPTLATTSNYSSVTSVSQTDPNITAGQLVTTSPTSLNLINSGLLTTASGKNALSISYPTTSTATAVQPSPSSSTLYTFNPKAIGSTPTISGSATTSSISFTLSSISSNTVSVGDMVVGISAVPVSSTTTQAAYVSNISGGVYTVTFVPALASNPSVTGVSVVSFFPSSSTSTSTYASVQYQAWSNFIYLDQTERDWFAKEKQDLLITQVQRIVMGTNPVQELALAQPVKFIAFPCVNYSQIYANGTGSVAAANYQLKTQVNGVDVGDSRHLYHWVDVPQYFNTPWGYIHNNQTANVAIISYCLDTSKLQPTGTLNFSRLDNYRLVVPSTLPNGILGLAGPVNYPTQYLYAVNYNIFRIQNGLGSILYSN